MAVLTVKGIIPGGQKSHLGGPTPINPLNLHLNSHEKELITKEYIVTHLNLKIYNSAHKQ